MNITNNTSDNLNVSEIKLGDYLCLSEGPISSSIRIIEVNEQGFRCRRVHLYHNGEEFFMNRQMMEKSLWRQAYGQMCFLG